MTMPTLSTYNKTYKSPEDLVQLLKSRGLTIEDEAKAVQYISSIGYYRLSAYMYPLLSQPKSEHLYKQGSTFRQVMKLYRFDKKWFFR
jgi:abortive infection bacteriophage resistance protein